MTTIRGLICRLILPERPADIHWEPFFRRVSPNVNGFLLDYDYWHGTGIGRPWTAMDPEYLREIASYLPPTKIGLVHITGETSAHTLRLLQEYNDTFNSLSPPENLFWIDLPLRYHSNRGLVEHFENFSALTTHPMVLENDPARVAPFKKLGQRANIRTHILKSLAQLPGIVGMVHHGDLKRAFNYGRAVSKCRDFSLLDGNEKRFLDYPSTTGIVSTTVNLLPEEWGFLVSRSNSAGRRDPERLYRVVQKLKYITDHLGSEPASSIAFWLYLQGLLTGPPRIAVSEAERLENIYRDLAESMG